MNEASLPEFVKVGLAALRRAQLVAARENARYGMKLILEEGQTQPRLRKKPAKVVV